jgi:hypothetical protein
MGELYRQVGVRNARKAARLANRGAQHPDPDVAVQVLDWAHNVMASDPVVPMGFSMRGWFVAAIASTITFGSAGNLEQAIADRTSRRVALAVITAAETPESARSFRA